MEYALEMAGCASSLWVVKCHSGLPSQEQHLVFKNPPKGQRKVRRCAGGLSCWTGALAVCKAPGPALWIRL